jgi:hypothetical protein
MGRPDLAKSIGIVGGIAPASTRKSKIASHRSRAPRSDIWQKGWSEMEGRNKHWRRMDDRES